jgi:thioredoxin 1
MVGLQHRNWLTLSLVTVLCIYASDRVVIAEHPVLITALDGDNFEAKVVNQKGFVLVEFQMAACAYCKMAQPDLKELASTMRMAVTFGQVDVVETHALAKQHSVTAVPTFILFKDGREVYRRVGYGKVVKQELQKALYKHIYSQSRRSNRDR